MIINNTNKKFQLQDEISNNSCSPNSANSAALNRKIKYKEGKCIIKGFR